MPMFGELAGEGADFRGAAAFGGVGEIGLGYVEDAHS